MQTVAKMADRLDMSADEAVEKLRFMLFEVEGVDTVISDEQVDLLIDIDDDPKVADSVRAKHLEALEKEKKKAEKEAAKKVAVAKKAAAKKAAAEKKEAAAKKKAAAAAKKKATAAKKPAAKKAAAKKPAADKEAAPKPKAKAVAKPKRAKKPVAEILSDDDVQTDSGATEEPTIVIGSAIDHEEAHAEIVRADGTHIDATDVTIDAAELAEGDREKDSAGMGLLAQADRQQEQDTKRKEKQRPKPLATPDPGVVADVIRKASQKREPGRPKERTRGRTKDFLTEDDSAGGGKTPKRRAPQAGSRKTGKTARKRQRKVERMRQEDDLRRSAAAAVREYEAGAMDGGPKKRRKKRAQDGEEAGDMGEVAPIIEVVDAMTVEVLAEAMEVETTDIILELMERNIMATKNQALSVDVIREIAEPQGFEIRAVIPEEAEVMAEEPDDPKDLIPRAPVITVMGHVDHGKTSLLDQVRKASVADGEAGGITQHIAAYDVSMGEGRVVFLDTPGHEAFTAMRARGAQVTDVVVLVVAADDGIMPQTREAIDHAKAAEVPIVVAVNKCDKPDAQPDRIRQELSQFELMDEQWGGKTIIKDISALNGEGIDELMELLVLETELLELKGNPTKAARGTVIESEITRGQGAVAWVLVGNGTLRVGDVFVAGESCGRVRTILDSRGKQIESAGPATPVVVTGFDSPPDAGDLFVTVADERVAKSIAEKRRHMNKLRGSGPAQHVTLEDFHARLMAGEKQELNIVLKADVQGSVDVLESSLPNVGNDEVQVKIVHSGVGGINESDVLLASASDAVVLGFHVAPSVKAEKLAASEGVDIRTYLVIYELIEEVRKALEGLLRPEEKEVVTGHAEIRAVFRSSALGNIAGCFQLDGEAKRDSLARLLRDDDVIYQGTIASLRRDKDSATSVQAGFECGIKLTGFNDIEEGDVIELYRIDEVAKTLA